MLRNVFGYKGEDAYCLGPFYTGLTGSNPARGTFFCVVLYRVVVCR
jgi:hypothetical protein